MHPANQIDRTTKETPYITLKCEINRTTKHFENDKKEVTYKGKPNIAFWLFSGNLKKLEGLETFISHFDRP